jgi:hypothetical protein
VKQVALFAACLFHVFCLANYSSLKMEATYFSDISVEFQRTIRHYILEDEFCITTAVSQVLHTSEVTGIEN